MPKPDLFAQKPHYRVKVSDGSHAHTYDVKRMTPYNDGFVLEYKNSQNKWDVVFMGRKYRPLLENGIFLVGKNAGNNSAAVVIDGPGGQKISTTSPIIGISTDPNCPGEDLSSIVRSHSLATGYKALYESKIPWKTLVIIIIIGIVIMVGIYFLRSRGG
jgi:hypothetical protein